VDPPIPDDAYQDFVVNRNEAKTILAELDCTATNPGGIQGLTFEETVEVISDNAGNGSLAEWRSFVADYTTEQAKARWSKHQLIQCCLAYYIDNKA